MIGQWINLKNIKLLQASVLFSMSVWYSFDKDNHHYLPLFAEVRHASYALLPCCAQVAEQRKARIDRVNQQV